MPKRRRESQEPITRGSKRKREDSPIAENEAPTPSVTGGAYSVRRVASDSFPALTTMAIKCFVSHLLDQTSESNYANTVSALQSLPDHLLQPVWLQLIEVWPGRMTHGFIIAVSSLFPYFGHWITGYRSSFVDQRSYCLANYQVLIKIPLGKSNAWQTRLLPLRLRGMAKFPTRHLQRH